MESRVQLFSGYKESKTVVRVDTLMMSQSKPIGALGLTFYPLKNGSKPITTDNIVSININMVQTSSSIYWKMQVN